MVKKKTQELILEDLELILHYVKNSDTEYNDDLDIYEYFIQIPEELQPALIAALETLIIQQKELVK